MAGFVQIPGGHRTAPPSRARARLAGSTEQLDVRAAEGFPSEGEGFRQSYSGVDYKITAIIPYEHRASAHHAKKVADLQRTLAQVEGTNPLAAKALKQAIHSERQKITTDQPFYKTFGEIQTLSISSRRSVEPVRRLGESSPAHHTRGPRTIAGSMHFILLQEDALLDLYRVSFNDKFDGEPFFIQDRLPPFNILIQGHNESGHMVEGGIFGVTLIADGMTLSIDDLYTEVGYTFIANWRLPMTRRTRGRSIFQKMGLAALPRGRGAISSMVKAGTSIRLGPHAVGE